MKKGDKKVISNFVGSPTRLPVQHREKPHCAECGAQMPTDFTVMGDTENMGEWTLEAVSFHLRCKCGKRSIGQRTIGGAKE